MATIGALSINITATTAEMTKELRQAQKTLKQFSRNVQSDLVSLGAKATSALKWLTAGGLAGGAVAIKIFADADAKLQQLRATLDSIGQSQMLPALVAHSHGLQAITRQGDDATQGVMALGLNMGISASKITTATNAAIGLSAALGVDLEQAMKMVAQATQGSYMMLGRYIPALKSARTDADKLRLVNEAAARGFRQEQEAAMTTAGRLVQLKNAVGDLVEMIGERLMGSLDGSTSLLGTMVTYVRAATQWVQNLTQAQASLIKTWAGLGLGVLAFLALVPKVIAAVKGMIAVYRALAAAQALSKPWMAVAGVAAGVAVMGATAYLGGLVDETLKEFSGSWDQAMSEAEARVKAIQTSADTALTSANKQGTTVAASQTRTADAAMRTAENTRSTESEQVRLLGAIEVNTRNALKKQY